MPCPNQHDSSNVSPVATDTHSGESFTQDPRKPTKMYVSASRHFWSFEADVCANPDIFSTLNFLICVSESGHFRHSDQGLCQSPDILAGPKFGQARAENIWDGLIV